MIASIRGRLTLRDPAGTVVLEGGPVGYRVFVSLNTLMALPREGEEVFLHTVTVVREDAIHLYGFLELQELSLFNLLLQVKGVGPRLALALLGGVRAGDLRNAIAGEDVGRICAVPGVGRKTAERIVLELRDKVSATQAGVPSAHPRDSVVEDVVSALANLGYRPQECRKAAEKVLQGQGEPSPPFEALIRECLGLLSGKTGHG